MCICSETTAAKEGRLKPTKSRIAIRLRAITQLSDDRALFP
ncbi:hypothetical protein [Neisseria mucosa]|nr:hypothetical protein [Neisseria mucosa]